MLTFGLGLTVIGAYTEEFVQPLTDDVTTEMVSPFNKLVVVNEPIGDGEPIETPLMKNSYKLAPDDE